MATNTSNTEGYNTYNETKTKHPDAIILMRVGDFYETFCDDARQASEILGITLTRRVDNGTSIELASFPHHALDVYLPRLVRAGKRVAIVENLEDSKNKQTEVVTPNKDVTETTTEDQTAAEPGKSTPKPKHAAKTAKNTFKEINCELGTDELHELGEPIAYFHFMMPKEARNIGKQAYKRGDRPQLESICVQPGKNKLIVTDTRILSTIDIDCKGEWPECDPGHEFGCGIDPEAVSMMAGKMVDVAVWEKNGEKYVTCSGCCDCDTQVLESAWKFPNWERLFPKDGQLSIILSAKEQYRFVKWLKANKGKSAGKGGYNEYKHRMAILETFRYQDVLRAKIVEYDQDDEKMKTVESCDFKLMKDAETDFKTGFYAPLLYLAVSDDFGGEIEFTDWCRPIVTCGKYRKTLLMPIQLDAIEPEPEPEPEDFGTPSDTDDNDEPLPF